MTIQDWGAIGEIIGGIAVLATLVYLAVQLRQNARVTHRQTYNNAADSVSRFSMSLAENPGLLRSYRLTLRSPDELDSDSRLQGFAVLDAYFTLMESYYLHNTAFGEVLSQERWSRTISSILATPGGAQYWHQRSWQFHDGFAGYVNTLNDRVQAHREAES